MAYVRGTKRSLSTEDARELGQMLKNSRRNTEESKTVLATDLARELLEVQEQFETRTDEMTDIRKSRAEIKATLDNAKYDTLVTFDGRGLCGRLNALCLPALVQVRAAMSETLADDGP